MPTVTIDQIIPRRDALPDDLLEVQRPGGGASASVPASSLPASSKEAILAALGLEDFIVTDTDITFFARGLDDVLRFVTLPLTAV